MKRFFAAMLALAMLLSPGTIGAAADGSPRYENAKYIAFYYARLPGSDWVIDDTHTEASYVFAGHGYVLGKGSPDGGLDAPWQTEKGTTVYVDEGNEGYIEAPPYDTLQSHAVGTTANLTTRTYPDIKVGDKTYSDDEYTIEWYSYTRDDGYSVYVENENKVYEYGEDSAFWHVNGTACIFPTSTESGSWSRTGTAIMSS